MELNGDERAADAIDRAAALAAQRAGTEHSDLIARFTQCYLHDTDVADLEDRAVDDLYGAVLSHWKLGYERRAGAAKWLLRQSRHGHVGMAIASHGGHDRHGRRAFLVDSVRLVLNRHELGIHLMIHPMIQVARDERGRVRAVAEDDGQIEAWTLVEIDRCDAVTCQAIESELASVLADVDQAVSDWSEMARRPWRWPTSSSTATAATRGSRLEIPVAAAFLRWLVDGRFVLLGSASYTVDEG